jgi:DNA (cytosine-5)-methyltransferase 1
MRFIDLYAGLGGFHLALRNLGHKCVFACEIDDVLNELYERNFGIRPARDIREVKLEDIPEHEILCAGFPCQPFSKAGKQKGFSCPKWGNLFEYVEKILSYRKPLYFILENVPNIQKHDEGKTWQKIQSDLKKIGYNIKTGRLSPHQFGIPQIRERIFIVGSLSELPESCLPTPSSEASLSINSILDQNPLDARTLPDQAQRCLEAWQEFLDLYPKSHELPLFPIWSAEFGATYPYKLTTPHAIGKEELQRYKGSHGKSLSSLGNNEIMQALPSYARVEQSIFPSWKVRFIRLNRELYEANKHWIDKWLPKILKFPSSLQKLEWNCGEGERNIWNYVIQFRASGVRVKKPTTAPSLVAMSTTQVPIIGWERRYMTPRECARLQGMDDLKHLPEAPSRTFMALGNAVNVELVKLIAQLLIKDAPLDVYMEHTGNRDHSQVDSSQPIYVR